MIDDAATGVRSGEITVGSGRSRIDLAETLESGLTFLWRRRDGTAYDGPSDDGWYYTVAGGDAVAVRQQGGTLQWRSTTDAADLLRRRLRLDDDLDRIFDGFPEDSHLTTARRTYPGLRVVSDPFFPCLISFICSARTSVARIHEYQTAISREFGEEVDVGGETYHDYPRPRRLAAAPEAELRDLGLGFRAPYVAASAAMVADGDLTATDLRGLSYRDARERLQSFRGVGPKVADCVAMFALDHLEAVPIDTWTRRLIERRYPDLARGSDEATAEAFRGRFGEHAGYAQTYLYHYERSGAAE